MERGRRGGTIWDSPKLESVSALESLRSADELLIYGNGCLTSLDSLTGLESAGKILLYDNHALETVGLRQLIQVESLFIGTQYCPFGSGNPALPAGNASLSKIDGLDALVEYTVLNIAGNPNLESIEGIAHLADAVPSDGREVHVTFNPSLPHDHIVEVETMFDQEFTRVCGNLNDPEVCECSFP